jgi:hypothetical protein
MTLAFFLRSVFSHSRSCAANAGVERQPALVDDDERRRAVEPAFDPVEQIGQDGGGRAGAIKPSVSNTWTDASPRRSVSASSSRPHGPPTQ